MGGGAMTDELYTHRLQQHSLKNNTLFGYKLCTRWWSTSRCLLYCSSLFV